MGYDLNFSEFHLHYISRVMAPFYQGYAGHRNAQKTIEEEQRTESGSLSS